MATSWTTPSARPQSTTPETDSIPRIAIRDMFAALLGFEGHPSRTLEELRRQFCADRGKYRGDFLWSAARDNAMELQRLGLVEGGPFPKDRRSYAILRERQLRITDDGRQLVQLFRNDRAAAYDHLFGAMYAAHHYLRLFVHLVMERPIFVPVLTSLKEHVSPSYATANPLVVDVSQGKFDTAGLMAAVEHRLKRSLSGAEQAEIGNGISAAVQESRLSACSDDPREFAKKLLLKLNDIVIPAIFRTDGLNFDYRTHRMLWTLGETFRLWASVRSHPEFDGWLIFRTGSVVLDEDSLRVKHLVFDSGLQQTEERFLEKLFAAYQKTQALRGRVNVPAWEVRAVFCYANRCQPSVFNRLFDLYRMGDSEFQVHMEIQGQKPKSEEALRAGDRNVGSIRVARK